MYKRQEYEHNNTINFLDLSITKLEHRHKFSIYRKPTTTDTLINNTSNHPIQHKLAAFRTMIHRLNNIPLDEIDYKDELNTVKYLAESNGYDRTIVSKLLHKTQNKQPAKTENNKFITLTYINKQTEKIAHKFKKACLLYTSRCV